MSRTRLAQALLALAAFAAAAVPAPPRDAPAPPVPEEVANDAREFCRELRGYIEEIPRNLYLAHITRQQLLRVALAGLYEAARQPVPPDLAATVAGAYREGRSDELAYDTYVALSHHDPVRGRDKALLVALGALPAVLDPYSGLVGQQAFRQLDFPTDQRSAGLIIAGMTLGNDRPRFDAPDGRRASVPAGPLHVVQVIPGGPGQAAGLQPDDLIVRVNGKRYDEAGFADAARDLLPATASPEARSPVTATAEVLREGHHGPLSVGIVLKPFQPESVFGHQRQPDGSWDYLIDPRAKLGYVRLGPIWTTSQAEFFQALDALESQNVRGVVLDLRWCPGGYLKTSGGIARALLPPDHLVFSTPKDPPRHAHTTMLDVPDPRRYTDFALVVLVNGETSGGGELIAAAVQDAGRGRVAGRRTVGKASVQQPLESQEYALRFTFKVSIGEFYRPSGRSLQRLADSKASDDWGVRPDAGYEIPCSTELDRRLRQAWTLHALRPSGSREGLPADDPEADPVRLAALRLLREILVRPKS
jgi:carboxyl-terminal processing protease